MKAFAVILGGLLLCTPPAIGKAGKTPEPDEYYTPHSKQGYPGALMVGAEYCTRNGHCKTIGDDLVGFSIGGTAIGGVQGCLNAPASLPCLKAAIPVMVYDINDGHQIVALNSHFYMVAGTEWTHKNAHGTLGGPVMILYHGVMMPVSIYKTCYEQRQGTTTFIGGNPCADMPGSPFHD